MTRLGLAALLFVSAVAAAEEKRPPAGPPGTVSLPLAEYDRLATRAARAPKRPEPPPLPAALSRVDIRVRVTPDAARGTMNIDGEVFRAGVVKVPLVSGATLFDARLGARPLPLVSEGG